MSVTDQLPPSLEAFQEELRGAVKRDLHRQPRRRAVRASAVVACVGVAAAGLMVASPWEGGPSIVERAAAAIAPRDDAVIHQSSVTTQRDLAGRVVRRQKAEVWEFGQGRNWHRRSISEISGRRTEQSITPGPDPGTSNWDLLDLETGIAVRDVERGSINESGQTLMDNIRQGLEGGDWRAVRDTVIDGRTVTELGTGAGPWPADPTACFDDRLFIDRTTYAPVLYSTVLCKQTGQPAFGTLESRYSVAEFLPLTPENIALTSVSAQHPGVMFKDRKSVRPSDWPDAGERNRG